MARRTQIVCLCEGKDGRSIDSIFINALLNGLKPGWMRPYGSNKIRIISCGNRKGVIEKTPKELQYCIKAGADTTLMVWADCDDDCDTPDKLRDKFWQEAQHVGICKTDFDRIVFIFAKDRLENWIEFLQTGQTDEGREGSRVRYNKEAALAGKKLSDKCKAGDPLIDLPLSLRWSCNNWHSLVRRMR